MSGQSLITIGSNSIVTKPAGWCICCSINSVNSVNTHASAMYQFFAANDAAGRKSARPTRLMVGAMASGPINRSNIPISPLTPRITSNRDAIMSAPCICNSDKRASSPCHTQC